MGPLVGAFQGRATVAEDLPGGFDFCQQIRRRVYFRQSANLIAATIGAALLSGGALISHTREPTPSGIVGHGFNLQINGGLWIWADGSRNQSPPGIDAGIIVGDQKHLVHVWNNQVPLQASSLIPASLPGVLISGLTLPRMMLTGNELEFPLTIDADGAATIDGSAVLSVIGLPALTLSVTGTRAIFLMADPDWATSITLDLSFDTLIQSSRSGNEQRDAGRSTPARTHRYALKTVDLDLTSDLRRRLAPATFRPVIICMWMDGVPITSPAMATDTSIATGSTAGKRFVAGGQIILQTSQTTFLVADLTAVSGNALTVLPLDADVPAGSQAFPLVLCEPLAVSTGNLVTDAVRQGTIELVEDLGQTQQAAVVPAWDVYKGFPIFELPANWATSPTDSYAMDMSRNSYGPGRREIVQRGKQPRLQQTIEGLVFDAPTALLVEGFFRDRLGRLRPFWFADMAPLARVVSDAVGPAVTLEFVDYANYFGWAMGSSRSYLAFVDQVGNMLPRKITSVIDNHDGTETYNLDLEVGLTKAQISRVSLLLFVRFDQDVLSLEYITNEIARAAISVMEVPWETPA